MWKVADAAHAQRHDAQELAHSQVAGNAPAAGGHRQKTTLHHPPCQPARKAMKRILIAVTAVAAVLFASVVTAWAPPGGMQPAIHQAMALASSWYPEDIWALVAALVAMALIVKRRKR